MNPAAINDGIAPRAGDGGSAANFDFWPHKGTAEWVSLEFEKPVQVRAVKVWWFDDTGSGECRLPASWKVLYRAGDGAWRPVAGASEYAVRKGEPVEVTFEPVTTGALRLEIGLPAGFSSGMHELEVN